MAEVQIPARIFATAAREAADLLVIHPERVFDASTSVEKRARAFAIAGMIEVFSSNAVRPAIAQGFGLDVNRRRLNGIMDDAKRSPWWTQDYVAVVAQAVRVDCFHNPGAPHIKVSSAGDLILEDEDNQIRQVYAPRNWRPARIITPLKRCQNATSFFAGDPPPGRREFLAALESRGYNAGSERNGL